MVTVSLNRQLFILIALFSAFVLHAQESNDSQQQRPTHDFDKAWLLDTAKTLATKPYKPNRISDSNPLAQLSYDEYQKIQFQRGAEIWAKQGRSFRVIPLHPGFLFKTPVNLNLVVNGVARRVLYTDDIFDYDQQTQEKTANTKASGYSGFTITNLLNNPDKWDEFLVFQGGTYLRAVGQGNWYGLSARGLAINTASPKGEEFPVFTDFFIERPQVDSSQIVIHALMQSKSASGAYTFTAIPGENTIIEVEMNLFPRVELNNVGIAPLTSMFLFNPMGPHHFDDSRPQIHDSDGLLFHLSNGEQVWRPLANPERLQASVFSGTRFAGFGLFQRAREFHQFEDTNAHYQDRPSAWVEPTNDWGQGSVKLIEIPASLEIHDNIVAYFQPKQSLKANTQYTYAYRLHFGAKPVNNKTTGKVVRSASGQALNEKGQREFIIDYRGGADINDLTVNASTSNGLITHAHIEALPNDDVFRVVLKLAPQDADVAELRVTLHDKEKRQWGETWLYRWVK